MASTYINRTQSDGNSRTWTLSLWVKKTRVSDNNDDLFFSSASNGTVGLNKIEFSTDTFQFADWNGSSLDIQLKTNRLFRDTNGWYHIVLRVDTTQSTASDRVRLYVNGVQETSFSTATYPSQNHITEVNVNGKVLSFCRGYDFGSSSVRYMDCVLSHIHLCDGYSYDASAFGSTDSTTGEWKINTSPSVTYGTNGFFILKDGNSVTDQSGNSNNFTVGGGTLTNTEDSPSNVFATINPLDNYYNGQSSGSISNGNTKIQTGGSSIESYTTSTLGASSGKFYCEMKLISSTTTFKTRFGVAYEPTNSTTDWLGKRAVGWSYREDGRVTNNNSNYSGTWNSYTSGDIIALAMDLDNNKLYFSKNGTWQNSGDPTSGATGTGGVTLTAGETYLIGIGDETGGYSVCEFNFGNGYFGTTAVSSAGTNASGIGIFEYDVPAGFTALSTKGLNE